MSNMELREVVEKSDNLHEPQNHGNHYNAIQNGFDLTLHGYVAVDQP
jgi:hypothetical protein